MHGRLYPIESDWCEWRQDPPLACALFVQVARSDNGRVVLVGLRIDGAPTADLLRSIPVGRIEAAANAQLTLAEAGSAARGKDMPEPAVRVRTRTPAPAAGYGWETTDPRRALDRPPAAAAPDHNGAEVTRRGRPDDFYQEIAHAYLALAQTSTRPASDLAETRAVPVTTTHRWVKEARRRGFLPPGRPGTAG